MLVAIGGRQTPIDDQRPVDQRQRQRRRRAQRVALRPSVRLANRFGPDKALDAGHPTSSNSCGRLHLSDVRSLHTESSRSFILRRFFMPLRSRPFVAAPVPFDLLFSLDKGSFFHGIIK